MSLPAPIAINIPDAAHGSWRVESFDVSERDASLSHVRSVLGRGDGLPAGTYKRLIRTRREVFMAARGLGRHD